VEDELGHDERLTLVYESQDALVFEIHP